MTHCMRHYEEPVMGYCKDCGRPFCNRCLVFPFGDDKPPYCIACAIANSGVRNSGKKYVVAQAAPRQSWAERSQARSTKRALKKASRQQQPILAGDDRSSTVPVPKGLPTPASRFRRGKTAEPAEPTTVD